MKRTVVFLLALWVLSVPTPTVHSQEGTGSGAKAGTLVVLIDGFENDRGVARMGLCISPEEYKGDRETFRQAALPIKSGKIEWVLKDLPWGKYAVKVYHDQNSNGILDKNAVGMPEEDYGFSNNARGLFGPPDYEAAVFKFAQTGMTLKITVK